VPYWTTDIGGFSVYYERPRGYNNPEYRELFTRWFQYGTFCPIFRVHGSKTPREMWYYGEESFKSQLKFDHLRYRLMPYIYSLAGKVTQDDYTLMRGLVMDFGTDKNVLSIDDQFMFGPSLLVNPVTKYKATSRQVYLPLSAGWYDFWTGNYIKGGQTIEAAAPLETMPLYVKAGSIIPMGPFIQYATEKPADPLEIRIYKGANGSFNLYEDESENYNYEKGMFSLIAMNWDDKKKTLTIEDRKGEFPGMLKDRTFNVVIVGAGHGTGVDMEQKIDKVINYQGKKVSIKF
jgi:alpha-D-xyloside xylohydrolase